MLKSFFALSFLIVSSFSSLSMASDFGIGLGVRSDSATSNTTGTNISANTDYMGGVVALLDVVGQLQARTGIFYTMRSYQYSPATGLSGTANFSYVDVPLGVMWKFSDYGGPFVGANFALNVSSSCPGSCTGVSSLPVGWQLGAQFKFAPDWGGALYYEASGAVMTGIDQPKAVVAQLYFMY